MLVDPGDPRHGRFRQCMRVLTLALVTVPGVYLLQWGSGCFAKSLRSWLSFTALAKEIFFPSELLILLQEWLI